MAIINAQGTSWPAIMNEGIRRLTAYRRALEDINDFYAWLSSVADADLEDNPINAPSADVLALRTAMNDAQAGVSMYRTGTVPASYSGYVTPDPPYVFGSSQILVIGPQ